VVSVTTPGAGGVPAAPSNLAAVAASSTSINLTWIDNAANETSFQLQRSTNNGGNWTTINNPAANATAYANTGLTANTTYWYRIRAVNAAGNSAWSNVASVTTPGAGGVPVAPSNLRVTTVTRTSITLAWNDNSTDETDFQIQRSTDGINFTNLGNSPANATGGTDSALTPNTNYWYRVRARNAAGNSAWSNVVSQRTNP
jgi:titin